MTELFKIVKRWKQRKCLQLINGYIKWRISIFQTAVVHYSSLNREESLIHMTKWIKLEHSILNEITQAQSLLQFQLYERSNIIHRDRRWNGCCQRLRKGRVRSYYLNNIVLVGKNENFLEMDGGRYLYNSKNLLNITESYT